MELINLIFHVLYISKLASAIDLKTLMKEDDENISPRDISLSNVSFCKYPGLICKSCKELVKCIERESGTFEEILIQTCPNEETCLRNQCTTDLNPKCDNDHKVSSDDLAKLFSKENYEDNSEDSETISYSYDSKHCKISGLFCKSCTDLIKCIEVETGLFKEILIKKCSKDETCLLNRCSTFHNARCLSKDSFMCTATGTFPDPYDCQIYHICIKGVDVIIPESDQTPETPSDYHAAIQCRHGFGYNYGTSFCEDPLHENNGFCPHKPPVPICGHLGKAEKLGNTPYYYVCVETRRGKLIPIMHMCPHGTILNHSGKCE